GHRFAGDRLWILARLSGPEIDDDDHDLRRAVRNSRLVAKVTCSRNAGSLLDRRLFGRDRRFVTALRIVADLHVSFALGLLFEKVHRAALRARTRNWAGVQRELTFRIAIARIENAAARAALDDFSLPALRALH